MPLNESLYIGQLLPHKYFSIGLVYTVSVYVNACQQLIDRKLGLLGQIQKHPKSRSVTLSISIHVSSPAILLF